MVPTYASSQNDDFMRCHSDAVFPMGLDPSHGCEVTNHRFCFFIFRCFYPMGLFEPPWKFTSPKRIQAFYTPPLHGDRANASGAVRIHNKHFGPQGPDPN